MIRVTIDLLPQGREAAKRCLGTMDIWLVGVSRDHSIGAYKFRIFKWGPGRRIWKAGMVPKHRRKSRGPWDLLLRCLWTAIGDRVNAKDRAEGVKFFGEPK